MAHHVAVIVLLGVITSGAILGIAMQRDANVAEAELSGYEFEQLARDAALTGLNLTVQKLAESFQMQSWNSGTYFNNEDYASGRFTVEVTATNPSGIGTAGDTVDVIARGWQGEAEHVIFARYARDKDDKGIPPAFKNAIISDLDLELAGNMLVAAINDEVNATIHTNSLLGLANTSLIVEGYGTYTEAEDIHQHADRIFRPNIDFNGDEPNYYQTDHVDIPSINAPNLESEAQSSGVYITNGTPGTAAQTFDGDAFGNLIDFTDPSGEFWSHIGRTPGCVANTCGTEENPFVLYVDGPIDFSKKVEIKGHGFIVANGEISVAPGGVDGGGVYGAVNDRDETQVVMAAIGEQGNMNIGQGGGNTCLGLAPESYTTNPDPKGKTDTRTNSKCVSENGGFEAGISLYAEGSVHFSGTPVIVGGVVAKETTFGGGGNPWITYASAHEGTLDLGFEYIVPIGPILIAFSEF